MKLLTAIFCFTLASILSAQTDSYIEILRSDFKAEKVAIITAVMEFTDTESEKFWPVYREYELKRAELGDQTLKLIKNYAENYETMSDEKAKELVNNSFDINEDKLDLKKKYFKKISKAVGIKKAAKFIQLDNQFDVLVDFQITSELPLLDVSGNSKQ
ncbi:MAG: hypothetical protein KAQ90_01300 [Melioribacteraceae bacterium]|nr:hypothetical protein [Melioribacteraceae bacterium]